MNTISHIGIYIGNNQNNLIIENSTISNTKDVDGLMFWTFINSCFIKNCNFNNNAQAGISFFGSLRNVIIENCYFTNNKYGIEFFNNNFFNKIINNNFIDQETHIQTKSNGSHIRWMFNIFRGNYWDNWNGIFPFYHVYGLFNWDFHPISEPNNM